MTDGQAHGVRLTDGTMLAADVVVCTASAFDTHLSLLSGRHVDATTLRRFDEWQELNPIAVASYGVGVPLTDAPAMVVTKQRRPLRVGGISSHWLSIRTRSDAAWLAPRGHTVVQCIVPTGYEWWRTRGPGFGEARERTLDEIFARIAHRFPEVRAQTNARALATPLSYWRASRAWHAAYAGRFPSPRAVPALSPQHLQVSPCGKHTTGRCKIPLASDVHVDPLESGG